MQPCKNNKQQKWHQPNKWRNPNDTKLNSDKWLFQANTTDKHSKNERVKRDQRKTKKNGMRKMRDDMKMVHKRNRKVC